MKPISMGDARDIVLGLRRKAKESAEPVMFQHTRDGDETKQMQDQVYWRLRESLRHRTGFKTSGLYAFAFSRHPDREFCVVGVYLSADQPSAQFKAAAMRQAGWCIELETWEELSEKT